MDDIYSRLEFGYDPETIESCPLVTLPPPTKLPVRATVNPQWLPPVGHQMTPSCFVWSSVYGLATYHAARAGNYTPQEPAQQASPYYAYIRVLEGQRVMSDVCTGGHISWCFNLLAGADGTPSMQEAPEPIPELGSTPCDAAWAKYGGGRLPSDRAFAITGCGQIEIKDASGLASLKGLIVQGTPLAYGTSLYTDFPGYGVPPAPIGGWPIPYVGNGQLLTRNGKPVGHCMMIIGYDDAMGAVLIQNSFGTEWGTPWHGSSGYIWMAYGTFQKLAQGGACFITE